MGLVRAKVAAETQKPSLGLQRTRRILELARRVAAIYRTLPAELQTGRLETRADRAQAEAEMFQVELDDRLALAEFKLATEALEDNGSSDSSGLAVQKATTGKTIR